MQGYNPAHCPSCRCVGSEPGGHSGDGARPATATLADDDDGIDMLARQARAMAATSCSGEHGTCDCAGTVFYGGGGQWIVRQASGPTECSNSVFGADPNPGRSKECRCQRLGPDGIAPSMVELTPITTRIALPESQHANCQDRTPRPDPSYKTRNVVLAMGSSYDKRQLRNFAHSCAEFVASGACIVFRKGSDKRNTEVNTWIDTLPNVFLVFEGSDYFPDSAIAKIPESLRHEDSSAMKLSAVRRIAVSTAFHAITAPQQR